MLRSQVSNVAAPLSVNYRAHYLPLSSSVWETGLANDNYGYVLAAQPGQSQAANYSGGLEAHSVITAALPAFSRETRTRWARTAPGATVTALQYSSTTLVSRTDVTDRHDSPGTTLLSGCEHPAKVGPFGWPHPRVQTGCVKCTDGFLAPTGNWSYLPM